MSRYTRALGLGLGLAVCAGCVHRGVRGDKSLYTIEWQVLALMIVGGLALTPIGWIARPRNGRLGWTLLIVGPLLWVGAGLMSQDRAIVDAEHFEASRLFGDTSRQNLRFQDVAAMSYGQETRGSGRRRRTDKWIDCRMKDGTSRRIGVGTVLEAALPEIFERAARQGVQVTSIGTP